ncbi:MAG: phenylacetate--CoA ligase family protein [Acidobacteriota bacterium]
MKKLLRPVYYRLPPEICYGPLYSPTLALLRESETWDEGRVVEYQVNQLRAMLRHAARHVPYYRRLFRQTGFDPEQVRDLADIRALPLLDKETVRANTEDLLADNIKPRDRFYHTTGGTMGKPLGFYNLRHSGGRERAFIFMQWSRVGFTPDRLRAMLRGASVKNARHWRYEVSERAYVFSNFHMTAENAARYAQVMREKKIPFLHSYPSAVIDFARHLKDSQIEPPRFDAVLASSENLYPGQREFVESFYGARLYSWYGHSENLILAGECEVSSYYHIFPEYGVVELLGEDGSPVVEEDAMGELVGTTLHNFAMPLIRYRTDDWAVLGPRSCSCQRPYRLLKAARGRWHQEMLVGKFDNLISVTALNVHSDVFDQAHQIQFYQRERGRVELRIKPKPSYTERDTRKILEAMNEKMGDTMEISLSFHEEIPLSPRGKFRLIVQELDIPRVPTDETPTQIHS